MSMARLLAGASARSSACLKCTPPMLLVASAALPCGALPSPAAGDRSSGVRWELACTPSFDAADSLARLPHEAYCYSLSELIVLIDMVCQNIFCRPSLVG